MSTTTCTACKARLSLPAGTRTLTCPRCGTTLRVVKTRKASAKRNSGKTLKASQPVLHIQAVRR